MHGSWQFKPRNHGPRFGALPNLAGLVCAHPCLQLAAREVTQGASPPRDRAIEPAIPGFIYAAGDIQAPVHHGEAAPNAAGAARGLQRRTHTLAVTRWASGTHDACRAQVRVIAHARRMLDACKARG